MHMLRTAGIKASHALRLPTAGQTWGPSRAAGQLRLEDQLRPWMGCSHWTTPYRPVRAFASRSSLKGGSASARARTSQSNELEQNDPALEDASMDESVGGISVTDVDHTEGIIVDRVETTKLNRPQLPSSIKKLNRLLSHDRSMAIPDSDLLERFVKGRGPGGQAINKTNSSVSLTHIPTGIRIQAQPTRSREENRKIARKILAERLDVLRAHEAAKLPSPSPDEEEGMSRKDKERGLAKVWSREEIRWEKERRRKLNKAKKSKKKGKADAAESADEGNPNEVEEDA